MNGNTGGRPSSHPSATAVRIGAFLGSYFHRFLPLGLLAVIATAIFAFSTVTLLGALSSDPLRSAAGRR